MGEALAKATKQVLGGIFSKTHQEIESGDPIVGGWDEKVQIGGHSLNIGVFAKLYRSGPFSEFWVNVWHANEGAAKGKRVGSLNRMSIVDGGSMYEVERGMTPEVYAKHMVSKKIKEIMQTVSGLNWSMPVYDIDTRTFTGDDITSEDVVRYLKKDLRVASTELKDQLIRLGYQDPKLRKHLRPVLDKIAKEEFEVPSEFSSLVTHAKGIASEINGKVKVDDRPKTDKRAHRGWPYREISVSKQVAKFVEYEVKIRWVSVDRQSPKYKRNEYRSGWYRYDPADRTWQWKQTSYREATKEMDTLIEKFNKYQNE